MAGAGGFEPPNGGIKIRSTTISLWQRTIARLGRVACLSFCAALCQFVPDLNAMTLMNYRGDFGVHYKTMVDVGGKCWVVLPHRDIDSPSRFRMITFVGTSTGKNSG